MPTFSCTLNPQNIGTLRIDPAQHPHARKHLSAASGLIRSRQTLYVVADDELHHGMFEDTIAAGTAPAPGRLLQLLDLGDVDGVPLSLTDGVPLSGGEWLCSAVAEDTSSSVADGACVASALGVVAVDGQVGRLIRRQGAPKVEGIAAQTDGEDWLVTMVTDPDDSAVASELLAVRLPRARGHTCQGWT